MGELRTKLIEELKPITHLIEGLEYISLGDILDYLIHGKRYSIPPATAGKGVDVGELINLIRTIKLGHIEHICKSKSVDFEKGMVEGSKITNKIYEEITIPKLATAIKEAIEKGEVQ